MTFGNLNILAIIPARGGSKSIPRKNLQLVGGISLIGHAAIVAKSLDWIDNTIISSDDTEIIQEAQYYGVEAPFVRPKSLSGDEATSKDMWKHAWLSAETYYGKKFDISLLLEPTSPLRRPDDLENVIKIMNDKNAKAVVTVSRTPAHYTPQKTLKLNEANQVEYFLSDGKNYTRRQDIPTFYHRNGVCYAVRREQLIERNQIIEDNAIAIIIERTVINIDEPFDLKIANWIFESENNQ